MKRIFIIVVLLVLLVSISYARKNKEATYDQTGTLVVEQYKPDGLYHTSGYICDSGSENTAPNCFRDGGPYYTVIINGERLTLFDPLGMGANVRHNVLWDKLNSYDSLGIQTQQIRAAMSNVHNDEVHKCSDRYLKVTYDETAVNKSAEELYKKTLGTSASFNTISASEKAVWIDSVKTEIQGQMQKQFFVCESNISIPAQEVQIKLRWVEKYRGAGPFVVVPTPYGEKWYAPLQK